MRFVEVKNREGTRFRIQPEKIIQMVDMIQRDGVFTRICLEDGYEIEVPVDMDTVERILFNRERM